MNSANESTYSSDNNPKKQGTVTGYSKLLTEIVTKEEYDKLSQMFQKKEIDKEALQKFFEQKLLDQESIDLFILFIEKGIKYHSD